VAATSWVWSTEGGITLVHPDVLAISILSLGVFAQFVDSQSEGQRAGKHERRARWLPRGRVTLSTALLALVDLRSIAREVPRRVNDLKAVVFQIAVKPIRHLQSSGKGFFRDIDVGKELFSRFEISVIGLPASYEVLLNAC